MIPRERRMPEPKRVPNAVPSAICHQFGKDIVLVISLDVERQESHYATSGRTPRDKALAAKLADVIRDLLEREARNKA